MAIKSFYSSSNLPNTVIESMIVGRHDKRDYIRMGIESEISFKKSGSDKVFTGKTIDLSATGIRFLTDSAVAVGDRLEIIVKPGVDITPPLEATMTVIRADEINDGQYDVAGAIQNSDS